MVEIERLVNGDLNKSIEQCVTLLMDVERKVHVLKNELAQTVSQLPGNRVAGAGVFGTLPAQGPPLTAMPPAYAPWTTGPATGPETLAPTRMGLPWNLAQTPWVNASPAWGYPATYGGAYGTYGVTAPAAYPGAFAGYGSPLPSAYAHGYPGYPTAYPGAYAPGYGYPYGASLGLPNGNNVGFPGTPQGFAAGTPPTLPYGANLGLNHVRDNVAHGPMMGGPGLPLPALALGLQGVAGIPFQGVPYATLPGFAAHQAMASPVPGFGYIW